MPDTTRTAIRAVLAEIEHVRARGIPLFLAPVALDNLQNVLRRHLAAPEQSDPGELHAIEDLLHAAEEWRVCATGTDALAGERARTTDLLRRLREEVNNTQNASSDAPQGAPLVYPGGAQGGTLHAVPAETPKDRRRRIIGTNLTRFREAAGMSKNELARRLEIDRGSIVRWETARWEPSPEHLEELAAALNVPVHEFYRDAVAA